MPLLWFLGEEMIIMKFKELIGKRIRITRIVRGKLIQSIEGTLNWIEGINLGLSNVFYTRVYEYETELEVAPRKYYKSKKRVIQREFLKELGCCKPTRKSEKYEVLTDRPSYGFKVGDVRK